LGFQKNTFNTLLFCGCPLKAIDFPNNYSDNAPWPWTRDARRTQVTPKVVQNRYLAKDHNKKTQMYKQNKK
jgi:hypothetical protein